MAWVGVEGTRSAGGTLGLRECHSQPEPGSRQLQHDAVVLRASASPKVTVVENEESEPQPEDCRGKAESSFGRSLAVQTGYAYGEIMR